MDAPDLALRERDRSGGLLDALPAVDSRGAPQVPVREIDPAVANSVLHEREVIDREVAGVAAPKLVPAAIGEFVEGGQPPLAAGPGRASGEGDTRTARRSTVHRRSTSVQLVQLGAAGADVGVDHLRDRKDTNAGGLDVEGCEIRQRVVIMPLAASICRTHGAGRQDCDVGMGITASRRVPRAADR